MQAAGWGSIRGWPGSAVGPEQHLYDLDSQEGHKAAVVLLDFNYEFLALLAPRKLQSIALYKAKIKNVSRDALLSFSGILAAV